MTNPAVANRQCIKRSGNTRRSGQTPINPILEEPRLQLIQMTSVWSKNLTGCVKSQPGTQEIWQSYSPSYSYSLSVCQMCWRSGVIYRHLWHVRRLTCNNSIAYLKNWTDNFFQIFFMGTSWVAVSINNITTRASTKKISTFSILMRWTLPSTGMWRARYLPSLIALLFL